MMFGIIFARFRSKCFDKETGYLLDYLTLSVKNKEIQKEISQERIQRLHKYYWLVFITSSVGVII